MHIRCVYANLSSTCTNAPVPTAALVMMPKLSNMLHSSSARYATSHLVKYGCTRGLLYTLPG